jgi:hypothetical protein
MYPLRPYEPVETTGVAGRAQSRVLCGGAFSGTTEAADIGPMETSALLQVLPSSISRPPYPRHYRAACKSRVPDLVSFHRRWSRR